MTTTQVKDAVTYVTLHATVSGKNVNFTSGTIDTKQDMSIYSNLTDDQLEDVIADMNAAAAATGTGLTYSYDKTTKTLFMCMPMTQAQLKQYSDMSDLSKLPSDVKVTSNAAKTQYSFTVTGEGTTIEYTITKD